MSLEAILNVRDIVYPPFKNDFSIATIFFLIYEFLQQSDINSIYDSKLPGVFLNWSNRLLFLEHQIKNSL